MFETDAPKQVTAQQVVYEYQQTPNAAVSNVQVNQHFQPLSTPETGAHSHVVYTQYPSRIPHYSSHEVIPEAQANHHYLTTQNAISPVHHSQVIRHDQNSYVVPTTYQPQARRTPLTPNTPQYNTQQYYTQQPQKNTYPQGQYLYVNGRIVYYPSSPTPTAVSHHSTPYPGIQVKHPAVSPTYTSIYRPSHEPQLRPQAHKKVSPALSTTAPQRFTAHQDTPRPSKPTARPPAVREVQQQQDEEDEEDNVENLGETVEDSDDDDGGTSEYLAQEEDEEDERAQEREKYYRRGFQPYDEDGEEDDDHEHEIEDSDREQSSFIINKNPKKTYKDFNPTTTASYPNKDKRKKKYVSIYDEYVDYGKKPTGLDYKKYSVKSTTTKKPKNNKKKPHGEVTIYKISKVLDNQPSKNKKNGEAIQGKESENVPVVHTQKIYKKHWVFTKEDR